MSSFGSSAGPFAWADEPRQITVPNCRVNFVHQAILASERPGVVAEIMVREGDLVRSGQVLIRLKDDVPRAELAVLTHQVESPESDAAIRDAVLAEQFARQRHALAVKARETNIDAVSVAELLELRIAAERALTAIDKARLEYGTLKQRQKQAQAELQAHAVTTPFAGVVTRVMKQRGEAVQGGDPLVELVDPTTLRVEGYVPVDTAARLRSGQDVELAPQSAEVPPPTSTKPRPIAGRLVFVDVTVEPVSQQLRIWAQVENSERTLRAGVTGELTIRLDPVAP